jgi:hypothetical protein
MDYPTSIDTFANPTGTDYLDDPSHSDQHAETNDAIEALEAKVGADSSAVTTSHDYKLSGVTGTDKAVSKTGTETLTNKTLTSPLLAGLIDGWISAGETWTFSSVDDPTGIFTVSGDVSSKYSAGMRIKFTNGGNTIYGIITAVSYSSPNTSIKFLHQIDPTDNLALALMADSAITANYYSTQKAPYGFPLEPTKWSVQMSDANQVTQDSPTEGVWYNLGSLSLSVPIGCWNLSYFVNGEVVNTSATAVNINVTLSTANNSASDAEFLTNIYIGGASGTVVGWTPMNRSKIITVTSKTPYYLNAMSDLAGMNTIYFRGEKGSTIIRAICAYL